jgi:plasmid stability protein
MSNLQIKGIDDRLYQELKKRAADENRSVSQQVLFLIRNHLARKSKHHHSETAAQTLISLAGSWEDSRTEEQIVQELKSARKSSRKFEDGLF